MKHTNHVIKYGAIHNEAYAYQIGEAVKNFLQKDRHYFADVIAEKIDFKKITRHMLASSTGDCAMLDATSAYLYLGIGRTLFFEKQKKGSSSYDPSFPRPLALSARRKLYSRESLNTWLASKSQLRSVGVK